MTKQAHELTGLEIAIIGMAVRFPAADDLATFWSNLTQGLNGTTHFSDEQLRQAGIAESLINDEKYVKVKGVINESMSFEPQVFGYNHREAQLMDPQLRIYHECVFQALADSSYQSDRFDGKMGLYGGAGSNPAWTSQFVYGGSGSSIAGQYEVGIFNGQEYFNTRVANKLNLTGPAVTVQTACSSSLVAVHLAVQGLIAGDCDIALAGGVEMTTDSMQAWPDVNGYLHQEGMIYSPEGLCRAFDANANGTVPGDGAGVVVLKRLDDAIEDLDHIYAVIKGSAVNNDGNAKAGYTAPSVQGQVQVLQAAFEMAEIDVDKISYIEAHGTGTSLGDPIEIKALTEAFDSELTGFCRVGSVKSNLGHLGAAAGVAGLIKAALSLHHQKIPPTLNYDAPNPVIKFDSTPFVVNDSLHVWQDDEHALVAGVSSFGIGGTNAHVVLEQWLGHDEQSDDEDEHNLLLLSATNEASLKAQSQMLHGFLTEQSANSAKSLNLSDVTFSLQQGRHHLPLRQMVYGQDRQAIINGLIDPQAENRLVSTAVERHLVFMFPGQGAQHQQMAAKLYQQQPLFAQYIDECFDLLETECSAQGDDDFAEQLKQIWLATDGDLAQQINQTQYTQPLLFIVEYSLACYLLDLGLEPWAMIGHSVGEYVAATLAQVFSLSSALSLVMLRGKLMAQTSAGSMLAVAATSEQINTMLPADLAVAAENSPNACVVSGASEAISSFAASCEAQNIKTTLLPTSHGYHSQLMDSILPQFEQVLQQTEMRAPNMAFISNLTGEWITKAQATDPQYWMQHLRQTVRFEAGINTLCAQADLLFIEVGPGRALSSFVRQNKHSGISPVVNLLSHNNNNNNNNKGKGASHQDDSDYHMLQVLGRLHLMGAHVEWEHYHQHNQRSRVALPGYHFNRSEFLPNVTANTSKQKAAVQVAEGEVGYFTPSWSRGERIRTPISRLLAADNLADNWLIFVDEQGHGVELASQLRAQGKRVVTVQGADKYQRIEQDSYSIKVTQADDYSMLLQELIRLHLTPQQVVHLWQVGSEQSLETELAQGFYSLVLLAQAIGGLGMQQQMQLTLVSEGCYSVSGQEVMSPARATVSGALRVIAQEYPQLDCQHIDMVLPIKPQSNSYLAMPVLTEILAEQREPVVAYRGAYRWQRQFDAVDGQSTTKSIDSLQTDGHYLITGGLGGIGLALATAMASTTKIKLTLLSRQALPAQSTWPQWLAEHSADNATSLKITQVQALEQLGAQVQVLAADVADTATLADVIAVAQQQLGPVDGLIHAAGVPGGGAVQLKQQEVAEAVMAAKIQGTANLARIFAEQPLDFVVLCSSITAILGGFGQVDYTAANAYLDACANADMFELAETVVAINFDPWKEVGMAVNTARDGLNGQGDEIHPLLGRAFGSQSGEQTKFKARFSAATVWALEEHKIMGKPTLPGTAYLEMARAACQHLHPDTAVEIADVYFLAPLVLQPETEQWCEVTTELIAATDGYQFVVSSKIFGQGHSVEHVRGRVKSITQAASSVATLSQAYAQCPQNIGDDPKSHIEQLIDANVDIAQAQAAQSTQNAIESGPHWDVFRGLHLGEKQGIARLTLDSAFVDELAMFKLHPAVLDSATAFLSPFIKPAFYIPLHYRSIKQFRPLTQTCYSHARLAQGGTADAGTISFDLTVFDQSEQLALQIEGFSMRQIVEDNQINAKGDDNEPVVEQAKALEGLTTEQGVDAFAKALSLGHSQLVASLNDINVQEYRYRDMANIAADSQLENKQVQARPELANAYVAAKTDSEKTLANLWQEMLRLEQVGINDDFFELGGDSLMLMQVHAKMGEHFDKNLAIAELYNFPTIKALAAELDKGEEQVDERAEKVDLRAAQMKAAMNKRRSRQRVR